MTRIFRETEERTCRQHPAPIRRAACTTLAGVWLLMGIVADLQAQPISAGGHSAAISNVVSRPSVHLLPWVSTSVETASHSTPEFHTLPDPDVVERTPRGVGEICRTCISDDHCYELMPDGLLYKSYLAGEKEPRFQSVWLYETGRGWVWETAIGGRFGLIRHGTRGAVNPEGWQIDVEGAAFPRIDPVLRSEMDSIDIRAGIIATWRRGPTAVKAGYYHISAHIGDEYLLRFPNFPRIEYVRDSLILGITHDITCDLTVYGEIAYAAGALGGAKPLEFQFGAQYSPAIANGLKGSPYAAVNGHLREDFNFGGSINVVAGWQWRGAESNRLFRAGFQYYNGKSLQYQFFDKNEELIGLGFWFDF